MSSQPAFAAGAADGVVEIQLFGAPSRAKLAQAAQRDLDVARAEFELVVVVLVLALVPDLHRAAVAAPLSHADADALRVVAVGAEGAGAAGADPLAAALVAFFCSSKRFLSVSISSSQPIFSMAAFSLGAQLESRCLRSHSSGTSWLKSVRAAPRPLK